MGARAAAGGVVDDHGDRGVRDPELARQSRLWHSRHADDVRAVPLQPVDLRRRFEAWSLGRGVDRAVSRGLAASLRRGEQPRAQARTVRLGEIDVLHSRLALEEGALPAPGVVDDLVRDDDRPRAQVAAYASN